MQFSTAGWTIGTPQPFPPNNPFRGIILSLNLYFWCCESFSLRKPGQAGSSLSSIFFKQRFYSGDEDYNSPVCISLIRRSFVTPVGLMGKSEMNLIFLANGTHSFGSESRFLKPDKQGFQRSNFPPRMFHLPSPNRVSEISLTSVVKFRDSVKFKRVLLFNR